MLPPDFREILASRSETGEMALTTIDGCLYGFPLPDWQEFEESIDSIVNPSRKARDFRRRALGNTEVMAADAQGRIRLTREHLEYAGIEKEAVLLGQGRRFELWNPERLEIVLNQDFDDISQSLAESGIDLIF